MRTITFLLRSSTSVFVLALCAALMASGPVVAQSSADTDKDGKISDAERARRDADKVFSFIKFHTVRPATAPAPAPRPAPRPAAPVVAAAPAAVAAAPAAVAAAPSAAPAVSRSLSVPTPAATPAASIPESVAAAAPALQGSPAQSQPAGAATAPGGSLPATPVPVAPATQPVAAPEPEPEHEEEVPLRLLAYVSPEMNAQVQAAMTSPQVIVPVRFVVQPNGTVSSAVVRGNVPRKVGQSAVRAVQQWRFDKIPAVREVDVEIAFKAGE